MEYNKIHTSFGQRRLNLAQITCPNGTTADLRLHKHSIVKSWGFITFHLHEQLPHHLLIYLQIYVKHQGLDTCCFFLTLRLISVPSQASDLKGEIPSRGPQGCRNLVFQIF